MAQALVHTGHTGVDARDMAVGTVIAALVHAVLIAALWLAPPTHAPETDKSQAAEDGCASVVSPACVGATPLQQSTPTADTEKQPMGDRRCPDPILRLQRREAEPPPSIEVDILRAELVAAKGSETGTELKDAGNHAGTGGAVAQPKPKATEGFFGESKLGDLIKQEDQGGEARKKKLGDLIGKVDGKQGGEGKVNQTGSAYWREVGTAVKSHFELPPSVPVWERAGLKAKVRVTRMGATGAIISWAWEKKSGNDEFDKAVAALLTSYKSGMRSLPAPSVDALSEINSRGGVIELRGGH